MRNNRIKLQRTAFHFFVICILIFGLANEAKAKQKNLTVAVEITAPCVMHSGSGYTGFDIELWEAIAQDLGWTFTYHETDLKGIFTDLVADKADVAFSCITVTDEREKLVDFSHHYLDSGLRIMVLSKTKFSLTEALKSIFSPIVVKSLTYIGLFIILCGHVFWCVERGHKFISTKYLPGIFQAYWYVLVTMTTVGYGDIVPRKWIGRVMAFVVMIIGIGFFGWTIAQLSSAITLQKLHSDISDHRDLRDRLVATVANTTSVAALEKLGAFVVSTKTIDQAYEKLLNDEVHALVFDAPTILYYARNQGAGRVSVVGPLFDIQYYGFLFPQGSGLRELVNRALLKLRRNGTYDNLYNKWFGSY
ncbi:MAG: transporter substrate-binding domain-containing protein [Desulfobacterales bacterium]|nr:transporter substrate-binding domain-containing protein [Deltaproteobacteria bacterium]NNL78420.1 transporter substrate-binding domain-containing protein [Desulfobacterales bacterium]